MKPNLKLIIITFTLISILICPASASPSDLDISAILPSLISQGGNVFIEDLGNQLYQMGAINNASEAQGKIAVYMGNKNNFIERPGVQEQKNFNAFWFLVVYILYIGYGAARISGEKGGVTRGFAAQESYTRTYMKNIVLGGLFFIFYLRGIDWACTIEWLIAHGFTMNAMDIMPNDAQHGVSYLIIAITNIFVWSFMILRDIIVYIVIMHILWLICMEKLPIVGYAFALIISFGVTLFFSRVIISFLFMAGAIAIETLGLGGLVLPYLILMGLIIIVCLFILLTPILLVIKKIMNGGGIKIIKVTSSL
jgi:hypothetical protein